MEARRIAREREEAIEREKEQLAAEMKGKKYEGRRKAGDPVEAATPASGGDRSARKIVRARRPTGGGGGGGGGTTTATGGSPADAALKAPAAPNPFAGFSLLAPAAETTTTTTTTKPSILSRLSGAPTPFVAPAPAVEDVEKEEEEEEEEAAATPAPVFAPSMFSFVPSKPVAAPAAPVVAATPPPTATTPAATTTTTTTKVKTPLAIELGL